MDKTYRPYQPRQRFLLPPSPQDWLPENHLCYFLMDMLAELDLEAIYAYYQREARGYPKRKATWAESPALDAAQPCAVEDPVHVQNLSARTGRSADCPMRWRTGPRREGHDSSTPSTTNGW